MISRLLDNLRQRGVITVMAPYTVVAWLVMQVVALLQPALAFPIWIVSFFTVLLIAGFPVAFYIAWFFEYTEHGLKRTTVDPDPSQEPLSKRHWAGLVVTSLAALGIGYVSFGEVRTNLAKDAEGIEELALEQSIAVLPFKDQSADQDQRYLSEGIAEEMTSLLGRMAGLKVAAASSTFRLSERDLDPVEIGRRLDVATLLGGSIRSQGDQLKVRVELINVEDGKVLWTQNFSRKLENIFAVEEEITRSIVNLLQDRYLEKGSVTLQSKTANTDAYVLYLKGEEEFRKRTTESMKAARKLFEEAVGIDPEYASAHVGVAKSVLLLAKGDQNVGSLDPKIAATLAEQALDKAIVRSPDHAGAFASLGRVHVLRGQNDEALSAYDKALSINPNLAIAHLWKSVTLRTLQRYEAAVESLRKAASLDPTSSTVLHNLGFFLSQMSLLDEAEARFSELLALYPDLPQGYKGLGHVAWQKGELAKSVEFWGKAVELSPESSDIKYDYLGLLFTLQMEEVIPLATDPFYGANILLLKKEYEALHEKMAFDLGANPDDPWIAFEAGWYQMLVGDLVVGADLLIRADENLSDQDRFAAPMCMPGIEIAFAYQLKGDLEKAEAYIAQCERMLEIERKSIFANNNLDHLEARLHSLRKDGVKGAEALGQAYDNGWREWWVDLDPLLDTVRQDPEGSRITQEIKMSMENERTQARLSLAP